jgi:hypothetical protein
VSISAFTFAVEEVFAFSDGVTVFVGRPDPAAKVLAPCDVDVMVDDHLLARARLTAERTQGRRAGLRSVETRHPVDVAAIRGHQCILVYRE